MDKPTCILKVMVDLWKNGKHLAPRNLPIVEIENAQFEVDYPFSTFIARGLDLNYLKKEFKWYLSANPYNKDIIKASKNWERFRQPDGKWFSNYGQYWFGEQHGFHKVVDAINDDVDTRQAIIPMLSKEHVFAGNPDVVCTKAISFRVREGKLNMTVSMRSNDIVWGVSFDLPCFWWLWEMVSVATGIPRGTYVHCADSLHVYEKHFDMISEIIEKGKYGMYNASYPAISDVDDLLEGKFESEFGKWLLDVV